MKNSVERSFSRAADRYEAFSGLQKKIGIKLLDSLPKDLRAHSRILDVGMGTGWLTEKIAQKFPLSEVTGVDFAQGMVQKAREKDIDLVVQADARRLPFEQGIFDLVFSNCVYQWVDDLREAFDSNYRVLKEGGFFYFSLFGAKTLHELRVSLGLKDSLQMPDQQCVADALKRSKFNFLEVESFFLRQDFPDIFKLIAWLKAIGANAVTQKPFIGKNFLINADRNYQKRFSGPKGIYATFEIIMAKARK